MAAPQLRRAVDAEALAQGVLAGDRLLLARAITHVENEGAAAHTILGRVYAHAGRGHIIGVTGAPGSGKSTLVTALAQSYRALGLTVAVVAIDPSSPFTGGALLGDRVRMRTLSGDSGVFIRSMATRGSLGGLSKTTGDVVTLLDAAGFERVIVETVGVGQAEVEIAGTAHTTLVVEAPGMGDEVQAIKAGILEIGDILVVNKADRPGVERTVRALEMMLEIENDSTRLIRHHGQVLRVDASRNGVQDSAQDSGQIEGHDEADRWRVTVMKTVAMAGEGVEALRERIEAHRQHQRASGESKLREQVRIAHALENIVRAELNRRILARIPAGALDDLVERIRLRETDPYTAAADLLAGI